MTEQGGAVLGLRHTGRLGNPGPVHKASNTTSSSNALNKCTEA